MHGAINRALGARVEVQADWYLGLESGLVDRYGQLFEEAWACLIAPDGQRYLGYSSGLALPEQVRLAMEAGEPHPELMNRLLTAMGVSDSKDTWSAYTGGQIARTQSLLEAVRNCLVQAGDAARSLYRR